MRRVRGGLHIHVPVRVLAAAAALGSGREKVPHCWGATPYTHYRHRDTARRRERQAVAAGLAPLVKCAQQALAVPSLIETKDTQPARGNPGEQGFRGRAM